MLKVIICLLLLGSFLRVNGQQDAVVIYKFPFIEQEQAVRVKVYDGLAIYQGDIILGRVRPSTRGGAEVDFSQFKDGMAWTGGIIPYTIDSSVDAGSALMRNIRRAIDTLNARTVLNIVPRVAAQHADYVTYKFYNPDNPNEAGASYVGRQGGQQFITLTATARFGNIVHETLHAAGVMHEQSRPDRSNYITIHRDRIQEDAISNFDSLPSISTVSSYDFNSIMHYNSRAFPKVDGTVTIEVKRAYRDQAIRMGQRDNLSPGDIATLQRLYPRTGSASATTVPVRPNATATTTSASGVPESSTFGVPAGYRDTSFTVQLIAQPTNMTCWAASIAMIYGWFRNVRIDPVEIRDGIGVWSAFPREWRTSGLLPNEPRVFQRFHFCCEPPRQYSVDSLNYLLRAFGPLWVACAVDLGGSRPEGHVRVITGMHGDGTPEGTYVMINDPWGDGLPSRPTLEDMAGNLGRVYEVSFRTFLDQLSELTDRERSQGYRNPIYIVHAPSFNVVECSCN